MVFSTSNLERTNADWHYDGVPGRGGLYDRKAPVIEPGKTDTVRLIPQHSGSFSDNTQ